MICRLFITTLVCMPSLSTCITYDDESSLLLLTLNGEANSRDVVNLYNIASQYAQMYQCDKILVDVSDLKHNFAAADLLEIMPKICHLINHITIARVINFDGYMHDLFKQKAHRFNLKIENFECFRQAKAWLMA